MCVTHVPMAFGIPCRLFSLKGEGKKKMVSLLNFCLSLQWTEYTASWHIPPFTVTGNPPLTRHAHKRRWVGHALVFSNLPSCDVTPAAHISGITPAIGFHRALPLRAATVCQAKPGKAHEARRARVGTAATGVSKSERLVSLPSAIVYLVMVVTAFRGTEMNAASRVPLSPSLPFSR